MSGHNKWTQIKHQKAVEDAKKSRLFSALAQNLANEARRVSGDRGAPSLRQVIEKARAANMPQENIDRAIERALMAGAGGGEEVLYEAYGPGGVALLIKGVSVNKNKTFQEIKHLLSGHGVTLGTPGSVTWAFEKQPDGDFRARTPLATDDAAGEKLRQIIETLQNHPDVTDVFTNAENAGPRH